MCPRWLSSKTIPCGMSKSAKSPAASGCGAHKPPLKTNAGAMDKLRDDTLLERELVSRYILPALGLLLPTGAPLTADIAACCRRIAVRRYEVIEAPGHWHQGYAYWFEHALTHSYYLEEPCDRQQLELLTPSKPFMDAEAVLYREDRKSVSQGKSVSDCVDLGGCAMHNKNQ